MIAKCIKSEKEGRKIFYGAMISESVIALVWAAAGVAFYGTTQLLSDALANGASNVVYEISTGVLGVFGGVLAVAGVIVCPITSGGTAFPAAFMSAVSLTYIMMAQEGFRLDQTISYISGASFAAVLFVIYLVFLIRRQNTFKPAS